MEKPVRECQGHLGRDRLSTRASALPQTNRFLQWTLQFFQGMEDLQGSVPVLVAADMERPTPCGMGHCRLTRPRKPGNGYSCFPIGPTDCWDPHTTPHPGPRVRGTFSCWRIDLLLRLEEQEVRSTWAEMRKTFDSGAAQCDIPTGPHLPAGPASHGARNVETATDRQTSDVVSIRTSADATPVRRR